MYEYSGSIISDLKLIKFFLKKIVHDVNNYIDDEDLIFDIKLILNELVVNGAMHGNELEESKRVKLDLEINDKYVKISVEDEGEGIDYSFRDHKPKELNTSGDCTGRGLILVDGLADEFTIDENKIVVIKTIC